MSTIGHMLWMAVLLVFIAGCSSKQISYAWQRTKTASANAALDPMTWVPASTAALLYSTDGDTRITRYFMEHHWANDEYDELFRDLNGLTTYATAVLIDGPWESKARRVAVEWTAFAVARKTVDALNANFPKETPNGKDDYAIGSYHALSPFAGAAMTRRNVAGMDVSSWVADGIVGMNYLFATSSTLTRVQGGGHSFADQLVSVTLGNFIGLFFYDAFMLDDSTRLEVAIEADRTYVEMQWRF